MDKLWRLATAMFSIVAACGLFLIGYVFSGGQFNTVLSVLLAYAMLFLILFGIAKGLVVMIDYHREQKEENPEE